MGIVNQGGRGRRALEKRYRNAYTAAGPCKITKPDGTVVIVPAKKGAITKFRF